MAKTLLVLLFLSVSGSAFSQNNALFEKRAFSPPAQRYGVRPATMRMPAEWEELQAVIMAWPYLKYSAQDDPKAVEDNFKILTANCWIKIAAAVQDECELWIKVRSAEDSIVVKKTMAQNGSPLKNYKFVVSPGENFWIRDYGPMFFYYGSKDSIGVIDARYHRHQSAVNDGDEVPSVIADMMNYPVVHTPLFFEAGNIDTDGYGNAFFTSRVHQLNSTENGWGREETVDSIKSVFNLQTPTELRDLPCDGGTGHVDMFFKMLDEQTVALSQYPDVVRSSDRFILEENLLKISSLKSVYGTPYRIVRVPMPTSDNGKYQYTRCEELNLDPRTYINGIFVNKTFILPVFSNSASGNSAGDTEIVRLFKKNLPGYKIVPVDSRILSLVRGGIHCITMQVPADNPIRFTLKKFPEGEQLASSEYPIETIVSNRDGIRVASVEWRKKGDAEWSYQRLKDIGQRRFSGMIDGENLRPGDTVEYFFQAKSYNGKKLTHPITAPAGYRTFTIAGPKAGGIAADRHENTEAGPDALNICVSPSPARENASVTFILQEPTNVTVSITDMNGREVEKLLDRNGMEAGKQTLQLSVGSYPEGMYACLVTSDKKILAVKKFFVKR